MKTFMIFALFLTKVGLAHASIPSLDFILQKAATTNARQIIAIEQEVTFKLDNEESVITENWLVEGDKNLKLTANGKGLLKTNVHLNYLYNGNTKTFYIGKNKQTLPIATDFYPRILFIKSFNTYKNYISEMGIPYQHRLSRADGRIAYAVGKESDHLTYPQLWFDQDEFILRKIRLPSLSEIELSDVSPVGKDGFIAKTQTVSWGPYKVTIKVKNVAVKNNTSLSAFYPQNLDQPSEMTFANKTALTEMIEQFYQRFR